MNANTYATEDADVKAGAHDMQKAFRVRVCFKRSDKAHDQFRRDATNGHASRRRE